MHTIHWKTPAQFEAFATESRTNLVARDTPLYFAIHASLRFAGQMSQLNRRFLKGFSLCLCVCGKRLHELPLYWGYTFSTKRFRNNENDIWYLDFHYKEGFFVHYTGTKSYPSPHGHMLFRISSQPRLRCLPFKRISLFPFQSSCLVLYMCIY